MKIGILTFHRSHNFGTVLQAYALYTTLNNYGHDVEMINYWPSYRNGQYDLLRWNYYFKDKQKPVLSDLKAIFKRVLCFPERLIRYTKFRQFIKTKYKISNTHFKTGAGIKGDYDVVFFGSDQIWRYNHFKEMIGFDEVFFGRYPQNKKTRKVAYAASMGVESLSPAALNDFSSHIKNFHSISVREDSLLNLTNSFSSSPATQVLDHTFLLTAQQWRKLVHKRTSKKKYLLFYQLILSQESRDLAYRIAKEKGLDVVEVRGYVRPFLSLNGINTTAGPFDFLSLFAHADYVVSTSFHGVAFSIIFQKDFSALGFGANSSRVKSLLSMLGLKHCLVEDGDSPYTDAIDYTDVNLKLEKMRQHSFSFIKENLRQHVGQKTSLV